ncbi:hypothetical protein IN07_03745 [Modestobacter caceresii]|uniref:AAA+ ATPase domain-containing protein n=1 Tax=Modestobacter caceresii TaxID=1522368 RepID=A0A098YCN2_9ACTN|nr:AAA family ATPase [Modestobacter caceresii]KGH48175.1 hypothetical protein IN07_03745 [Modestobacter caceresii]
MTVLAARTGAGLRWLDPFDPADWPERERPTHLVSGLLSTTLTVLAGAPTAGKTHLAVGMAAALLNGERTFLGRELSGELDSVAFICTDADGAASVRRRIAPLVATPGSKRVRLVDYTGAGETEWTALTDAVADLAPGLLVVDNVLGLVDDVNDNGEAKRVTAPLLRLTQQGTAVLLLTHTGKPGPTGPAQGVNAAIGARTWSVPARVKATLTAREKDGRRQIKAHNNDGEPVTVDARLDVVGEAPVWTPGTGDGGPGQQEETKATAGDMWDALAERVVQEQPPGVMTARGLARHYAASVGMSEDYVRTRLGSLVCWNETRWEHKG